MRKKAFSKRVLLHITSHKNQTMANIEEEIASFDLQTSKAVSQIDKLVNELKQLEAEYRKAESEGKDLAELQARLASVTAKLENSLAQETKTLKGMVAQTKAAEKANNELSSSQDKVAKSAKGIDVASNRNISSMARVARGAKSFGGAAAGAVAVLNGFGPAAAVAALATEKLLEIFMDFATNTDYVAEATRGLIPEITKERTELDGLFLIAKDENTTKAQRAEAIEVINEKYGDYLPNLIKETASVDELTQAQSLLNKVIIEQAVARFKAAKLAELQQKAVEGAYEKTKRQADLAARSDAENYARNIAAIAGPAGLIFKAYDVYQTVSIDRSLAKTTEEIGKLDETAKGAEAQLKELFEGMDFGSAGAIDAAKQINERIKKDNEKASKERLAAAKKAAKEAEKTPLAGSIADLERMLSEINKQINEQVAIGDQAKLAPLVEQYKDLKNRIEEAKAELDALINPEKPKEVKFNFDDSNDALREALAESAKEAQEAARQAAIKQLSVDKERLELQAALEAREIESANSKRVDAAKGQTEQLAKIEEQRAAQRTKLDDELTAKLIANRLAVIELEKQAIDLDEEGLAQLNTEAAKLNLQLEELNSKRIKIEADTKPLESLAQKVVRIGSQIFELGSQVGDFFAEQAARTTASYDKAVDAQRSALDELLSNQENASVQAIEIETQRLEALEKEQEKAKEREAAIIQIQIAANAALAIARAVAEGGGIGSAITVAAALASLAFGFVAAKQQAAEAFFDGTTFVERGKNPKGRDTIPAYLNEGEAVIPTATNAMYAPAIQGIYDKAIPAKTLNEFVKNYRKRGDLAMSKLNYSLIGDVNSNAILLNGGGMGKTTSEELALLHKIAANTGSKAPVLVQNTKLDKNGFTTYMSKQIKASETLSNKHK